MLEGVDATNPNSKSKKCHAGDLDPNVLKVTSGHSPHVVRSNDREIGRQPIRTLQLFKKICPACSFSYMPLPHQNGP